MIHYSLLPKEEIKLLRREYRTRLVIVALFFISSGVVLGIISLIPSYTLSHTQDLEASRRTAEIQKSREASGVDQIEKNLVQTQAISEKILEDKNAVVYSQGMERVIAHKTPQISLTSFEISHVAGTSTPHILVIQGKAATRDALITFKKELESDAAVGNIELPLSDLAQSKNVTFAIRLNLKK